MSYQPQKMAFHLDNKMHQALIGIIGGSGLYQMDGLKNARDVRMATPFGDPSEVVVVGELNGVEVAFLARHGRGHRLLPTEVPYRANMHALKQLGVKYVLSFSAVGSLQESMRPPDMVLPDQFIDMTKRRESSFFGQGAVAHFSMAQPICPDTSALLGRAAQQVLSEDGGQAPRLHHGGTYLCMEGPQFSSLAESNWYRSMGAHVIGMTNMPEAKLAREAQMAYATLAMVTDFDCWHPKEAHVTADMALKNLLANASRAQRIAQSAIELIGRERPQSIAHTALASSLVTPREAMAPEVLARLEAILR